MANNESWLLVIGATGGIGQAICKTLSKKYSGIILVARNVDKLKALEADLSCDTFSISCDLKNPENVKTSLEQISNKNIKLQALCYSAGVSPKMCLENTSIQIVQDTIAVNYSSFIESVRWFVNHSSTEQERLIVAISSIAGRTGGGQQAVYSATKAAIDISVKSLAIELVEKNIRINAVAPASVETGMLSNLTNNRPETMDKIKYQQPLGIINPDYVAETVAYLLSSKSKYITGQSLLIGGGR